MNSRGNSKGDEVILNKSKPSVKEQKLSKIAETDDSHLTTQ